MYGRGPYLYEGFIEVCLILLYLGDLKGHLVVHDDGVVDSVRSNGPYLECVAQCMEIMHIWCIRSPAKGQAPRSGKWYTTGMHRKLLQSDSRKLRAQMLNASYPNVSTDTLMPNSATTLPLEELRELFLELSHRAMEHIEQYGGVIEVPREVARVEIYLSTGSAIQLGTSTQLNPGSSVMLKDEVFFSIRLARSTDDYAGAVEIPRQVYWTLSATQEPFSLYEEIRTQLMSGGIQLTC